MSRNFCGIIDFNNSATPKTLYKMSEKLNFSSQYEVSYNRTQNQILFASLYSKNFPKPKFSNFLDQMEDRFQILAFGLLTNTKELIKLLSLDNNQTYSTEEIILHAYLKWGTSCSEKIQGDWSFVIWDQKKQEATLSMSQIGEASIFYTIVNNVLYFSTLLTGLVGIPQIPLQLDEEKIFSEFCEFSIFKDRTIYKNISFIHLGHYITYNRNAPIQKKQYWDITKAPKVIFKSDQEYVDKFYDLYQKNIKNIMELPVHWTGTLSGGLDSSSSTYLTSQHLKKQNKSLDVFSYVQHFKEFDTLNPKHRSGDETPFIKKIDKSIQNVNVNFVKKEPKGFISSLKSNFNNFKHPPNTINLWWLEEIYKSVNLSGKSTGILAAEGGNATISFEGLPSSTSLKQYQSDLKSNLSIKNLNLNDHISLLKKSSLGSLKQYAKTTSYVQKVIIDKHLNRNTFINKKFLKKVKGRKIMKDFIFQKNGSLTPSEEFRYLRMNPSHSRFGILNELGSKYDLLTTNTPRSVPMVEFIFGTPNHLFNRFGNQKYLFKRTFQEKLPKEVVFNEKKALQVSDIVHILRADLDALNESINQIKKSSLCKHMLDMNKLDSFLEKLSDPNYFSEDFTYEVFAKSTSITMAMFLVWIENESLLTTTELSF